MSAARQSRSRSARRPLAVLARLAGAVLVALLTVGVPPVAAADPTNLRNQLTDGANVLSAR
jgi:hypothetical protein